MRALIIGCGYVGLPLGIELVRQGHEVFGLRRNPAAAVELRAAGIQPLLADITRPAELQAIPPAFDWVVNCVSSSGGAVAEYRRVYLEGTRNLLAWLSTRPPEKFVYTGSTGVYGQDNGSIVTEESPAAPAADTAQILVETERLLLAAAKEDGFPVIILRVAGIYGPGRGYWLQKFLDGGLQLKQDGSRFLNMIHRDDVVGCIIAALTRGRVGEVYNAVDDEPVAQSVLLHWLASELKRNLPASADAGGSSERPKRGATSKRVSNRKLRAELGYVMKYPTFRQGYAEQLSTER